MNKMVKIENMNELYKKVESMRFQNNYIQSQLEDPVTFCMKAFDYYEAMDKLVEEMWEELNKIWSPEIQDLKDASKYYYKTYNENKDTEIGLNAYKQYENIKKKLASIKR